MVKEIDGVVKEVVPVPPERIVPPELKLYQSTVTPSATAAVIATVPVPQRELLPAVGAAGVAGCAFTTALADAGEVQPPSGVTVKVYVVLAVRLSKVGKLTTSSHKGVSK